MHELEPTRFRLEPVDGWVAGDSRTLAFSVVDDTGEPFDVSDVTLRWSLAERAYADRDDAVLSDADPGVEVVADERVAADAGEFEVRVEQGATAEVWGELTQRVSIDAAGSTRQTWVGRVVIDA